MEDEEKRDTGEGMAENQPEDESVSESIEEPVEEKTSDEHRAHETKELDKKPGTGRINFSISKKQLIIAIVVILVLIGGFFIYKYQLWQKAYDVYYRADVSISVSEDEKNAPLKALVEMNSTQRPELNKKAETDAAGNVKFEKLVKGSYDLKISSDGYTEETSSQPLNKGKNTVNIQLKKIPPQQASVSGTIKNYISEKPLVNISVAIGNKTAKTDNDGKFTINGLNLDSYQLAISEGGYLDLSKSINISDVALDLGTLNLVPSGRVVFVSNRDKGKSGIYTCNYDGSDQRQLVDRVGEYEDFYPVVSPDGQKVAFSSNRDGKKINNNLISNLYTVDIDGKNLVKVSDQPVSYSYRWLDGFNKILWQSYVDNKNHTYIYSVASKTHLLFGNDTENISNAVANSTEDKIAYSISSDYYHTNLYWTGLGQIDRNIIAENKASVSIIKFDNDTITYSYVDYSATPNKTNYFKYNVSTSANTQIDQFEYPKYDGSVKSPDGKTKASVNTRDGKSNVYITDMAGNNEKQLTDINTAQPPLFWSSDTKEVFFNSYKVGESALYVVSIDGGNAKKVVDVSSGGYGYGM